MTWLLYYRCSRFLHHFVASIVDEMKVLFAALVALGVAVLIVVLLKGLCFLAEFLNDQQRSREGASSIVARSSGSQPYNVRRLSERIYVICFDPPRYSNADDNNKGNDTNQQLSAPPTYEEAVRLLQSDSRIV